MTKLTVFSYNVPYFYFWQHIPIISLVFFECITLPSIYVYLEWLVSLYFCDILKSMRRCL